MENRYPAILDSWLFCTLENLFNRWAARATLLYLLSFSHILENMNEKMQLDNK